MYKFDICRLKIARHAVLIVYYHDCVKDASLKRGKSHDLHVDTKIQS